MSTWTKRSVDLKVPSAPGFAVEYAVRGAGAPVVAVHCSGSSHKQWTPLCDALGPNHRVVAPNLFGAGGTTPWPPHGRPQTLDDTAALVETAAKDALGDDDRAPIIVGHSHGRGRRFEVRARDMLRPEKMPHNDNHIGRGHCCRGTKLYVSPGGRGAV